MLPAMIRKFHEAKLNNHAQVKLWGTGSPKREFLYVDDLAEAVLHSLKHRLEEHLYNVGTGEDLSVKSLAELIQKITGHQGKIHWDKDKPDGTPRKLLDVSKLNQEGWKHRVELEEGIQKTYKWYLNNIDKIKQVKMN